MPRPERPLDPLAGPIQAFATELRKLRTGAGNPKYLQMARRTGRSRTALAEAAGGDHLPTWETVEAFVTACGADPASWRARWEAVDEQLQPQRAGHGRRAAKPPVASQPAEPMRLPRDGRAQRRMAALVGAVTALAVFAGSAAGAVFLTRIGAIGPSPTGEQPVWHRPIPYFVEIHSADGGMVYLFTNADCADHGCEVPSSGLMPGAFLGINCYTNGTPMRDGTSDPIGEGSDPKPLKSLIWYGAAWNGRQAFLPQVFVTPEYRNTSGLPECYQLPGVKAN